MKRIFAYVCIGIFVLGAGCGMVWGQATAQISGSVKDQSGAVLPGVEITATQTETGIARNAVTNETGSYILPNLALGPYRLEASLPGFRTFAQTGIVLQVNSSPAVNVVLEVGQVAETVEVQANAALVETRSSTLGSVVENERILELPLNGRTVTDLISLAGGTVQQAVNNGHVAGSVMLAVAGGSGFGVDYTLDGASHISFMSGSTLLMPFPDAMQEFKVENSGVSASRGNAAAVSGVTKSGTNTFHGDLFEFVRNDLFNARQYFAAKGSTLKRNQFGGTIGGPVVKNKLFFFGGYQGTTLRSDPADVRAFVPTPAILAGDWTAFTSPACNAGRQVTLRAPFVNNRIDPALYSKAAMFVVNWKNEKPFPITNNPCGEITYGSRTAENDGNYVAKVDYQKSAAHSLFGRYLGYTAALRDPSTFNVNALQDTGWTHDMQGAYALGSTYLLGSNMVQSFRLGVTRTALYYYNSGVQGSPRLFNWCDAGVKIYCAPEITRIYALNISGAFNLTSGFLAPHRYISTTYTLNDDVSLVRGNHQFAVGVTARYGKDNSVSTFVSPTQFTFNGGATGLGLADFLTGKPSFFYTGNTNAHDANGTTVALYAADSWKAKPRLTVNYGVRWEPFLPMPSKFIFNFNYDRFRQGIKSNVYVNAPAGLYYPGDPGFPKNGVYNQWLHFAPRAGLAWDVNGDGRMSVRASYALGYTYVPGNFKETYSGASPWGDRISFVPVGGLDDPWKDIAGGNIFPITLGKNAPFPAYGLFYSQPYNMKVPYSQNWTLGLQRQLGTAWLASASYTGSNIMHVWGNRAINPATYFPQATCTLAGVTYTPCSSLTNTDQRRRFSLERPEDGAKMSFVTDGDDGGVQSYSGMVLSLERRAVKGVTASANYTWSHCIGTYASLYNAMAIAPGDTFLDPSNRDRGNCDSDRRQVLNLTSVAETPQFANPKVRLVATGWKLSGIYRVSTGSHLTILAGSDRALNGVGAASGGGPLQRGSQVAGEPYGDTSGGPMTKFLNTSSFGLPDIGTLGNIGRNSLTGPKTWSFDLSLSRSFRIGETKRIEFRAEAYNVTNSFRPGNPNTTVTNNTFGVLRTSSDPRIMQYALKYVF